MLNFLLHPRFKIILPTGWATFSDQCLSLVFLSWKCWGTSSWHLDIQVKMLLLHYGDNGRKNQSLGKKKRHTFKNWSLIKNQQFLSYPDETWLKWSTHEVIIFTKFHQDRTKIVDSLLITNFWKCAVFSPPDFTS